MFLYDIFSDVFIVQGIFTLNSFMERSDMMSQRMPDLLPNYDSYTPGGASHIDCIQFVIGLSHEY